MDAAEFVTQIGPWLALVGTLITVIVPRLMDRRSRQAAARIAGAEAARAEHNGYAAQVKFWRTEANEIRAQHDKIEADLRELKATQEEQGRELVTLRAELDQARAAVIEFARGAGILIGQLTGNRIEPEWRPGRPLEQYCETIEPSVRPPRSRREGGTGSAGGHPGDRPARGES